MRILSHRGYWKTPDEKNQKIAFERSAQLNFGTETDVRDCAGKLLISHDMPCGAELSLETFLKIFTKTDLPIAMNIKADGLAHVLKKSMTQAEIQDWFVFDMSIPDMRNYLKEGIATFARMSEVEQHPVWMDSITGIWLDAFSTEWYGIDLIQSLLSRGLRVCIVSPELHGRRHEEFWSALCVLSQVDNLMLCTDFPEQAHAHFCSHATSKSYSTKDSPQDI